MARTEPVTITNMCMVCDGTRVLLQQRKDPSWPGIAFPGGHVERGEAFSDAVIREVFEETGLTVSHPRLCGVKDWCNEDGTRYMVLLYKADRFEGVLTSSQEGEVFWAERSELKNLPLAEGMAQTLRVFEEEELSEEFFYLQNGQWIEVLK